MHPYSYAISYNLRYDLIICFFVSIFEIMIYNQTFQAIENHIGIILFTCLALLTKETAVTILPMLLLTWVVYGRTMPGKTWSLFGIIFIFIIGFLAIQYYVETKNYLVVDELYKPGAHF